MGSTLVYAERIATLCEAARQCLAGRLEIERADSGMRTIAWVRTGQKDAQVAERARALGLEVSALSDFTVRHSHADALVLGFAGCAPAELKRGASVIARALEYKGDSGTAQTIVASAVGNQ